MSKQPSLFRRLFACPFGRCPFVPKDDDTGCWGECIHCGKRVGFVSRDKLRAYCDRDDALKEQQP